MNIRQNRIYNSMSGFTLLELLFVLAIGVILLTQAVPSMSKVMADGRRSSGTTELLIAMNLARSEALKRHRHITVCKSTDGENCGGAGVAWSDGWIVFANDSSANVSQRNAGEELLHVSNGLPANVVLATDAAVDNFISFAPNGRSGLAGSFTWCDKRGDAEARGVFVLPSGQARVSDHTLGGDPLACPAG